MLLPAIFSYLKQISKPNSRVCNKEVSKGEGGWKCLDCELDTLAIFCTSCFNKAKEIHKGHKILFNPKKKSFNRLNYYNFNNNNCLNNEKNHCLSFNISSNRIRNTSEKNNSRLNIRKEMSPRIGMSNSTINIKFNRSCFN